MTQAQFAAAKDKLLALANADPGLRGVRLSELPDIGTLRVDMDQQKLAALGLSQSRCEHHALDRLGRPLRQRLRRSRPGEAGLCAGRRRIPREARGSGRMVRARLERPDGALLRLRPHQLVAGTDDAVALQWHRQLRIPGLGGARARARATRWRGSSELAQQIPGTTLAWSGLSYQERLSSGQAPILYALSLIVVFLCLAALYESWSIPVAVVLVIPLGLVGAIVAVTLRGLINDVYLQIGLLTTMGLAAKNAILMIEFAEQAERKGARVIDAALEAAQDPAAADPDDQLLVHVRRAAAGDLDRRGCQRADRDRHCGDRRDAERDVAGAVLHPVVLRAGPARRARRHRQAAGRPTGIKGSPRHENAALLLAP